MKTKSGSINIFVIVIVVLSVLFATVAGLLVWSYVSYLDQKNNVDSKVATAVAEAKKTQSDEDEAKFAEREKNPMRQFVGPEDYGRLSFDYPKTWSLYVDRDATSGNSYEAYLNPITVPPVSNTQPYALRVLIESKDYDAVLRTYDSLVKKGDLGSSTFSVEGISGTRLDGAFTKDIRGAAVILKIRDKTVTLRTDADIFKADFEVLIKTIKFNQ